MEFHVQLNRRFRSLFCCVQRRERYSKGERRNIRFIPPRMCKNMHMRSVVLVVVAASRVAVVCALGE